MIVSSTPVYQNASIIRHLTIIQPGHTWIAAARVFPQVVRALQVYAGFGSSQW